MSVASERELWSRLASAGLTAGEMPATDEARTPWYVRAMLGVAGLIAAAFLLGFVGAALSFIVDSKPASVLVGSLVVACAYAVFRLAPRNDFSTMFALAVSFAGQALILTGLLGRFGSSFGAEWIVIAAIEALLAAVMPNFIHRVASAYAAGTAFAYACFLSGIEPVASGVVAAGVAGIWLNEERWARWGAIVAPIGYGLTIALLQTEGMALFRHSTAMLFRSGTAAAVAPWIGEAIVAAFLLVSVAVLLRRAGYTAREPRALLAVVAVAAICAASFKAPGIACGLMITVLGFSNGNRSLAGLGIAALLFYVSGYYYQLSETLLFKAGVLLATGAVLLAARWLMLSVAMPRDPANA